MLVRLPQGLPRRTRWTDRAGDDHDFVTYFFKQWVTNVPGWHIGASHGVVAPGTNNGAESCIKNTRIDAGNVVGSVGETMDFLLSQVEVVSKDAWDPNAIRKIDAALWRRAAAFSTLLNTPKVRKSVCEGQTIYCCSPRTDPESDDVCDRLLLSVQHAVAMVNAFTAQRKGARTTLEELTKFAGPVGARVFGFQGGVAFCSCPAFCHPHRCVHTLGLEIFQGKKTMPEWLDDTQVSLPELAGRICIQISEGSVGVLRRGQEGSGKGDQCRRSQIPSPDG